MARPVQAHLEKLSKTQPLAAPRRPAQAALRAVSSAFEADSENHIRQDGELHLRKRADQCDRASTTRGGFFALA